MRDEGQERRTGQAGRALSQSRNSGEKGGARAARHESGGGDGKPGEGESKANAEKSKQTGDEM